MLRVVRAKRQPVQRTLKEALGISVGCIESDRKKRVITAGRTKGGTESCTDPMIDSILVFVLSPVPLLSSTVKATNITRKEFY